MRRTQLLRISGALKAGFRISTEPLNSVLQSQIVCKRSCDWLFFIFSVNPCGYLEANRRTTVMQFKWKKRFHKEYQVAGPLTRGQGYTTKRCFGNLTCWMPPEIQLFLLPDSDITDHQTGHQSSACPTAIPRMFGPGWLSAMFYLLTLWIHTETSVFLIFPLRKRIQDWPRSRFWVSVLYQGMPRK